MDRQLQGLSGCCPVSSLRRKFDTFRKEPLSLWYRWVTKRSERQLRKRGYLDFLAHRPSEALPPRFADLWFLYQTVRHRKPRYILEFGSGCSTVILAQALWDNQRKSPTKKCDGFLYSVEADPYWADVTAKSVPAHLRGLCEVRYSPLLEVEYMKTPAFQHAEIPNIAPDFVYLDGPCLTRERQVAVDVLNMEGRFPPGFCMVVDGRWINAMFLRQHLKRQYVFKPKWLFGQSIFELVV